MQRVVLTAFVVALAGACADPAVTPPMAGESSGTLEVRCDGATTDVLTPIVQARTDGVHLVLENTSEHELLMQTDTQGEGSRLAKRRCACRSFRAAPASDA